MKGHFIASFIYHQLYNYEYVKSKDLKLVPLHHTLLSSVVCLKKTQIKCDITSTNSGSWSSSCFRCQNYFGDFVADGAVVCVREKGLCGYGWCRKRWSHFSADGSGVGIEIRRPASLSLSQQGAPDGGQWHRQRLVLIVCGHVGDSLPTVTRLVCGADVEGRVIGWAGGAVAMAPPCRFGEVGGSGQLWGWQGQWSDDWPVQAGDTAGVAGEVLLRDGATVRPILLTAVVLWKWRHVTVIALWNKMYFFSFEKDKHQFRELQHQVYYWLLSSSVCA